MIFVLLTEALYYYHVNMSQLCLFLQNWWRVILQTLFLQVVKFSTLHCFYCTLQGFVHSFQKNHSESEQHSPGCLKVVQLCVIYKSSKYIPCSATQDTNKNFKAYWDLLSHAPCIPPFWQQTSMITIEFEILSCNTSSFSYSFPYFPFKYNLRECHKPYQASDTYFSHLLHWVQ